MTNEEYIKINTSSRIPKYKQIIDSIRRGISEQQLLLGDKILSINALSEKYDLSRDTVEKAYNLLREQNIIESVKGKGFYVSKTNLSFKINVLFVINKLSTYKMRIYNAFVDTLGQANAKVDLDIYHCEPEVFKSILNRKKSQYNYFVIMPHFRGDNFEHRGCTPDILASIKEIPSEKLIILDRDIKGLPPTVGRVCQDFTMDIYKALTSHIGQLKQYKKMILAYPSKAVYPYPKEIVIGFRRFCDENQIDYEILDEIYEQMDLLPQDLYITIQESDLVNLVKQIREKNYILGKDIGVISYNHTPLKDLLGITVISTDFIQMGSAAANMILDKQLQSIKNDFNFIDRFSA